MGYPRGSARTAESSHQTGRIALAAEITAVADTVAILLSDTAATTPLQPSKPPDPLPARGLLNRQLVNHLWRATRLPVGLRSTCLLRLPGSGGRWCGPHRWMAVRQWCGWYTTAAGGGSGRWNWTRRRKGAYAFWAS